MRPNSATLVSHAGVVALLLLPLVIAVTGSQLWVAAVFEPVLLAWILFSIAPSRRRVGMQNRIEVACSPEDAFWFVSDPRNWSRYAPELEVVGPVDVPTHLGSVIHCKVHHADAVLDADETVTDFEPGRRFGTAILKSPHDSAGGYEFVPTSHGVAITYTFSGALSPLQAAVGGWLMRGRLVRRMQQRRGVAMAEVKRLLERVVAGSV